MFNDLAIHKQTKAKLERYLNKPGQALLLVGSQGSGKTTLAMRLAAQLLNAGPEKLTNHPYFVHIAKPDNKQDISVESIRELIRTLKLKVPGKAAVSRVVLIEDAQAMNTEAQNAFLKSLEEPNPGTVYLLTVDSKAGLLATVVSRTSSVNIEPISLAEAQKHFKNFNPDEVAAAWALSQGTPGLLSSLLADKDNSLRQAIDQAKSLLAKNKYQRLLELDKLTSDKASLLTLLNAMAKVYKALYRAAAAKNDTKRMNLAMAASDQVLQAQQNLQLNVMPRLVILRMVLKLPL